MQEQIISKMIEKIKSLEKRISQLETKSKEQSKSDPDIQFASYDGQYPTLCMGTLVIVVNGVVYKLNDVLRSGGSCNYRESCGTTIGEWTIVEENLPDELKQHADKIARIVNENVELGCCGGCM